MLDWLVRPASPSCLGLFRGLFKAVITREMCVAAHILTGLLLRGWFLLSKHTWDLDLSCEKSVILTRIKVNTLSASFKYFSFVSLISQDKKGISGKPIPAERRTIYQRHIRPSTMLAKSILEGTAQTKRKAPLLPLLHSKRGLHFFFL